MTFTSMASNVIPAEWRELVLRWIASRDSANNCEAIPSKDILSLAWEIVAANRFAMSIRESICDATLLSGMSDSDSRKLDEAAFIIEETLSIDPFNAQIYITRAATASMRNDFESVWKNSWMACKLSSDPTVLVAAAELLQYGDSDQDQERFLDVLALARDASNKLHERISELEGK